MIGRFRNGNKLSNNDMRHIYLRCSKVLRTELAVAEAIQNGFTDESKKLVEQRFTSLEALITNGKLSELSGKRMPRKVKKVFIKDISARYNLCLILLKSWDYYKTKFKN